MSLTNGYIKTDASVLF